MENSLDKLETPLLVEILHPLAFIPIRCHSRSPPVAALSVLILARLGCFDWAATLARTFSVPQRTKLKWLIFSIPEGFRPSLCSMCQPRAFSHHVKLRSCISVRLCRPWTTADEEEKHYNFSCERPRSLNPITQQHHFSTSN